MAYRRKVFFRGHPSLSEGYFVHIVARTYEQMRTVLVKNFYFLRGGNFAVAERGDGTFVCDDGYYQSLSPQCELLVLVTGYTVGCATQPSLESLVANSNFIVSHLQIAEVMGNVPMSSTSSSSGRATEEERTPDGAVQPGALEHSTGFESRQIVQETLPPPVTLRVCSHVANRILRNPPLILNHKRKTSNQQIVQLLMNR